MSARSSSNQDSVGHRITPKDEKRRRISAGELVEQSLRYLGGAHGDGADANQSISGLETSTVRGRAGTHGADCDARYCTRAPEPNAEVTVSLVRRLGGQSCGSKRTVASDHYGVRGRVGKRIEPSSVSGADGSSIDFDDDVARLPPCSCSWCSIHHRNNELAGIGAEV